MIARGEVGRGELVALIPCARAEAELFSKGLPAIERSMRVQLARKGARAVYPYLRELPPIAVGRAYVLRNPLLAELTQIRDGIEAAHTDAEPELRIAARARRRSSWTCWSTKASTPSTSRSSMRARSPCSATKR